MQLLKFYFKLLDLVLPAVSAKSVYNFLSNPRVKKLRDFEEEVLDRAHKERIPFHKFKIQLYSWGNEHGQVVFLVHGWEGQAGNFGALVDILLQKGYRVVAFDAPSHGKSSMGKTNMFEFADLISILIKKYRPQHIISHSFGSVTSMIVLNENKDIQIDKWVMVTTPHNFKSRINDVKNIIGVTDRTMNRVIRMIERDTEMNIDEMNIEHFGGRISNVHELAIIHSKADRVLPIESARIAHQFIPQSTLTELEGLGHYSILWSDELKAFISERF